MKTSSGEAAPFPPSADQETQTPHTTTLPQQSETLDTIPKAAIPEGGATPTNANLQATRRALLESARSGESGAGDALAQLFTSHTGGLVGMLRARGFRTEQIEDLIQETFINAFTHFDDFRGDEQKFFAWIAQIARNEVRDLLRYDAVRPNEKTSELPEPWAGDDIASLNPIDNVERTVLRRDSVRRASDLIRHNQKWAELAYCVGFLGMKAKEYSDLTDTPDSTIRRRLQSVREVAKQEASREDFEF